MISQTFQTSDAEQHGSLSRDATDPQPARSFSKNSKSDVIEKWMVPWNLLSYCLGNAHILDAKSLTFTNMEEATRTFLTHGFDLQLPEHRKNVEALFLRSLFFIRHVLMDQKEREILEIPQEIINIEDPRKILLLASSLEPRKSYKKIWCCALLKVTYINMILENDDLYRHINEARDVIFENLKSRIFGSQETKNQEIRFKDQSVTLTKVLWKDQKTRESIALKFLHKTDSLFEGVHDYIGVRLVVPNLTDTIRLLKILVDCQVISPHLVIPSRTRNTLIDFKKSKRFLDMIQELHSLGTLSSQEMEQYILRIPWHLDPKDLIGKHQNQHSSLHYRSFQITVRHLVRSQNPASVALKSLLSQLSLYKEADRVDPWISKVIPDENFHFFPLEIQILDEKSDQIANQGSASHLDYKRSQIQVARQRVIGSLLKFVSNFSEKNSENAAN